MPASGWLHLVKRNLPVPEDVAKRTGCETSRKLVAKAALHFSVGAGAPFLMLQGTIYSVQGAIEFSQSPVFGAATGVICGVVSLIASSVVIVQQSKTAVRMGEGVKRTWESIDPKDRDMTLKELLAAKTRARAERKVTIIEDKLAKAKGKVKPNEDNTVV